MEKNQYDLCIEVLRRFHKARILDAMLIVGSSCIPFYKDYFHTTKGLPALRTRDIDFLIRARTTFKRKVDVPLLLEDLGFVVSFQGDKGYIKLDHPDLILEFLVPERGRGSNRPFSLPMLGLNATPLRFLDFLSENTIEVEIEDFSVRLPHPIHFALHKLIISGRRRLKDKALKDIKTAVDILRLLIEKSEGPDIIKIFHSLPKKWQSKIHQSMTKTEEKEILELLFKK